MRAPAEGYGLLPPKGEATACRYLPAGLYAGGDVPSRDAVLPTRLPAGTPSAGLGQESLAIHLPDGRPLRAAEQLSAEIEQTAQRNVEFPSIPPHLAPHRTDAGKLLGWHGPHALSSTCLRSRRSSPGASVEESH